MFIHMILLIGLINHFFALLCYVFAFSTNFWNYYLKFLLLGSKRQHSHMLEAASIRLSIPV